MEIDNNAGKTPFDEAVNLAAQYDGPEEFQPKRTATPQMSPEKERQYQGYCGPISQRTRHEGRDPYHFELSTRATEPIRRIA